MRSQTNTLYLDGKPVKMWQDVDERGNFETPYCLATDKFKLELLWDEEEEKEIIKIDGILYSDLPFVD